MFSNLLYQNTKGVFYPKIRLSFTSDVMSHQLLISTFIRSWIVNIDVVDIQSWYMVTASDGGVGLQLSERVQSGCKLCSY